MKLPHCFSSHYVRQPLVTLRAHVLNESLRMAAANRTRASLFWKMQLDVLGLTDKQLKIFKSVVSSVSVNVVYNFASIQMASKEFFHHKPVLMKVAIMISRIFFPNPYAHVALNVDFPPPFPARMTWTLVDGVVAITASWLRSFWVPACRIAAQITRNVSARRLFHADSLKRVFLASTLC